MASPTLTSQRLRELQHYEPETGVFTRNVRTRHNALAGSPAGVLHKKSGYVRISVDGVKHYAHRLAWLYMTGNWPELEIDHRDGERANNAWTNLREATDAANRENQRTPRSDSRSGLQGVKALRNGCFEARIRVSGRLVTIGKYPDAQDAGRAYLAAKADHHPFFYANANATA